MAQNNQISFNVISIILPFFALVLVGCSTPAYFSVPSQRFQSPTVSGETFKGGIGGGISETPYVVTVKDINASPPSGSGSEITRIPSGLELTFFESLNMDLRLGFFERLEISTGGNLYSFKFQFLGNPRASASDGVVGALVGDYMHQSYSKGTADSNGNTYKLKATGSGGSLILGYRKGDVIVYLGGNYLKYEATTDVTQTSASYSYKGEGDQKGAVFGVRKESKDGVYAAVEWAYTDTGWETLERLKLGTFGAVIGYGW